MQVDALALRLRPRPMFEAADLGVRLVQLHAGSVWRSLLPLHALLAVFAFGLGAATSLEWLPGLLIFWLKPWLDRSLLFVFSRAAFGQPTRFRDLWRARATVWRGALLHTLTERRLSPWRSFTQPIYQLEGQRGPATRARRRQLLRGKRGVAAAMHGAFANVELLLTMGVYSLVVWFTPEAGGAGLLWSLLSSESTLATLLTTGAYLAIVMFLEPFYVAAGFAMYLNRRVELEAWDVEQEFRHAFAR